MDPKHKEGSLGELWSHGKELASSMRLARLEMAPSINEASF